MEGSKAVPWNGPASVAVGAYGGPFALFDGFGEAVVASAASEFAAWSVAASSADASAVGVGVLGSVESLPAGFSLETALTAGADGLTATVKKHGAALLADRGTVRDGDYATTYLGYSTDNGA